MIERRRNALLQNLPHCGAALAPGGVCDCTISQVCTEARAVFPELFTGRTDREIVSEIAGVVRRSETKEAPASSAKADEGGVEQTLTGAVPSYDNTNTKEDAR